MIDDEKTLGEQVDEMDDTTKLAAAMVLLGALDDDSDEDSARHEPTASPNVRAAVWGILILLSFIALLLLSIW